MTIEHSAWTGMVPVDDTALAVTDTGGSGRPVVYLNGSYADRTPWRRVIADLGSDFRHITYDERARGKSKPSADYSFEACVRDLDAVLRTRGIERPILVGWSYGALIAVHWAPPAEPAVPDRPPARSGRADERRPACRDQPRSQRVVRICCPRTGPRPRERTGQVRDRHRRQPGRRREDDGTAARQPRPGLRPQPEHLHQEEVLSNHSKILRNDFRAVADAVRELAAMGVQHAHRDTHEEAASATIA
jgi:pimeloyl-ACP methyl ester carboxylesterase